MSNSSIWASRPIIIQHFINNRTQPPCNTNTAGMGSKSPKQAHTVFFFLKAPASKSRRTQSVWPPSAAHISAVFSYCGIWNIVQESSAKSTRKSIYWRHKYPCDNRNSRWNRGKSKQFTWRDISHRLEIGSTQTHSHVNLENTMWRTSPLNSISAPFFINISISSARPFFAALKNWARVKIDSQTRSTRWRCLGAFWIVCEGYDKSRKNPMWKDSGIAGTCKNRDQSAKLCPP